MGQVIPWPGSERRNSKPSRDADGPKGRILLFLGVRYERHEDGDGAPSAEARRIGRTERPSRRRKRG